MPITGIGEVSSLRKGQVARAPDPCSAPDGVSSLPRSCSLGTQGEGKPGRGPSAPEKVTFLGTGVLSLAWLFSVSRGRLVWPGPAPGQR